MITWLMNMIWGKRDWQLIDKEVIPSALDRLLNNTNIKSFGKFRLPDQDSLKQTVIFTFKCSITGKVKIKVIKG